MIKPITFGSLLLVSSALVAPAALAQTDDTQTDAPASAAPAEGQGDAVEEQPEVSIPGAIVVIGRRGANIQQSAPAVVSVLSSADIARTGEGDIAGALQRVTGLSVVGSGFVYVRGLGDRYSLALLNGSPLPSPEPLRRVVPLDIFPTSVIASSLVQKSYSVNYPGEFGGGVINLTTKAVPKEPFFSIGISTGTNSQVFSGKGLTYQGGDRDWTGFDDGTRDAPAGLIQDLRAGTLNTTSNAVNLAYAATLINSPTTVLQRNSELPFDIGVDLSAGKTFDVGGADIGLIGALGFSNKWKHRVARQQDSTDSQLASLNSDFQSTLTENRMVLNGLIGVGAEFGPHKVRWTNLYVHDTVKQGQLQKGYDPSTPGADPVPNPDFDGTPPIIEQNTNWFARQLIDTQIVGEFDFQAVQLDLRAGYANTKRKAPYERTFVYTYNAAAGAYRNRLNASGGQDATIAFSDLNEDVYSGGADLSYELPTDMKVTLTAGGAYTKTKRTSERYIARYYADLGAGLPAGADQGRPDVLVSDYNIYAYNIRLVDISGAQGAAAYDAELEVKAGYGQGEVEIVDGLNLVAGVRYETADQTVSIGGPNPATSLSNDYWLPAGSLTWNFRQGMQFRLAASKTIARPQFRELARQLYQDYDTNREFRGNPNLTDSELFNAEGRYEWYFAPNQRLSIAGFYKKIDRPIETITFEVSDGQIASTFANAPSANLYGAEIEVQKNVPLDTLGAGFESKRLVLIGNYTYTKSKLKVDNSLVPDGDGNVLPATQVFTDGSPLTGQSDHIANVQIGIEDTDRLFQVTALFNYASKRVTSRGLISKGQPDIFEEPGFTIDLVGRVGFEVIGREAEVKLEARNLTGTFYKEYQESALRRIDINRYALGRSFSASLSLTF